MYILRSGQAVEEAIISGLPLGIMETETYEAQEFILAPGEAVVLMSDGVVERFNGAGQFLGYDRLSDHLGRLDPAQMDANAILRVIHPTG